MMRKTQPLEEGGGLGRPLKKVLAYVLASCRSCITLQTTHPGSFTRNLIISQEMLPRCHPGMKGREGKRTVNQTLTPQKPRGGNNLPGRVIRPEDSIILGGAYNNVSVGRG